MFEMSVQPLLDGAAPENLDQQDKPPEHHAAANNDVAALQAMPSDAFHRMFRGMMPLHVAAAHNSLPVMDVLIGMSPGDIDVSDDRGRTPVMHAVAARSEEALVWLVRHGADLSSVDSTGWTAVHWAAKCKSVSMTALLRSLGADVDAADPEGRTPLAIAFMNEHLELVEYLVLTCNCNLNEKYMTITAGMSKACAFWTTRCIQKRVGCHEAAPGEHPLCGPTAWSCGRLFPRPSLSLMLQKSPEQVQVCPWVTSWITAAIAVVFSIILFVTNEGCLSIRIMSVVAFISTVCGAISFYRASNMSPGSIEASASRRQCYEAALSHASGITADDADDKGTNWWQERNPLIHQMAIVAPPRSKYSSATRQCVPIFDHYCVFLRTPVGRDNFPAFFATIALAGLASVCLLASAIVLIVAKKDLVFAFFVVAIFSVFSCLWVSMTYFYIVLARWGLTTHEFLLCRKRVPAYLMDKERGYFNPHDLGWARNLLGRLCPRRQSMMQTGSTDDLENCNA